MSICQYEDMSVWGYTSMRVNQYDQYEVWGYVEYIGMRICQYEDIHVLVWGYVSVRIYRYEDMSVWGYVSMRYEDMSSILVWGYVSMRIYQYEDMSEWGYVSMRIYQYEDMSVWGCEANHNYYIPLFCGKHYMCCNTVIKAQHQPKASRETLNVSRHEKQMTYMHTCMYNVHAHVRRYTCTCACSTYSMA